jgi:hypothetical protein
MRNFACLYATAIVLVAAGTAHAGSLSFETPQLLPHGDPAQHPYAGGGEPSIAFDPSGDGHVYVTAPQGIPAAANGIAGLSDSNTGIGFWGSADHGSTWPIASLTGTLTGGGDSDVEVLPDHSVLAADLEAIDSAICISHDFGNSFPSCDNGITTNHQGPDNDREWLTRGPKPGEVYLTYHDFAGGFPIIEKSTDGGKTFLPCGLIIDPAGPAARNYTPLGGTLVAKPLVTADDTIYVEFATPDLIASPVGAKLDHLYMAVAKGGCTLTTVFKNHVIYENAGADLARIFQASALDGGGDLYVLAAGQKDAAGAARSDMWLFTSSDGAEHWSPPLQINTAALTANVFPAIAGGAAKGEALLGWFGSSTSGDPNNTKDQWRFYGAATYDGGKTLNVATVSPDVLHYGDICTQGLFCGLIPGQPSNRNLADFASVAIDPSSGCGAFAIPGDPYNRPDLPDGKDTAGSSAYVSRQLQPATCFTQANAGKPAASVGSSGAACVDRAAPVVHVLSRLVRSRTATTLSGSTSDVGCGAHGAGTVKTVDIAVARRQGKQCRFMSVRGKLAKARSCNRRAYLRAKGTARWSLRIGRKLPRGTYVVMVRATDSAGNTAAARRLSKKTS